MADAEALKLKNEGNELFVKTDFSAAYKKYSAAIKLDPKNAVLFCNRAACAYGLEQATELDPSYAKAWGRLAAAELSLERYSEAIKCWKRAIAALPSENLTPAQTKQRKGYETDLAAVEAKVAGMKANPKMPGGVRTAPNNVELPWQRANRMVARLEQERTWKSSAWLLAFADAMWERALTQLKAAHLVKGPHGQDGWFAYRGVLEGFTNALMADDRIFRISDPKFLETFNHQVAWEAQTAKAWTEVGAQKVMEDVPKRLEKEGWSSVRPALSVTVRGWIFRAFLADALQDNPAASLDIYTSALEVLRWGIEKYKDVPLAERGTVLQPTFIRGLKAMRLNQYMKVRVESLLVHKTNTVTKHTVPINEIVSGADEIIEELKEGSEGPEEAAARGEPLGFWYAYYRYPKALAHSLRGYAFNRQALKIREEANELTGEAAGLFAEASEEYKKSALIYPEDDPQHVWFLHCAFEAQHNAEAPIKVLVSTLDLIHASIPLSEKIWENSPDWPQMKSSFNEAMTMRKELKSAIESGTLNSERSVKIEPMG